MGLTEHIRKIIGSKISSYFVLIIKIFEKNLKLSNHGKLNINFQRNATFKLIFLKIKILSI